MTTPGPGHPNATEPTGPSDAGDHDTTAGQGGATADGSTLLAQIATTVSKYVILPGPDALVGVVLWIAATHAVPAWHCAPRLVIRAPEKRCGKSRLLDLVEALCHRPLMTTNASPSAVYRSIGMSPKDPPVLLIDEADAIFGPKAGDHEDLRGLLNAGHQRGRPTLRYDAGTKKVDRIETFAMAALAGIGAMPDTIEDRAVIIRMRRRAPGENVAPYRVRRDGPTLADLKDRLNTWVRHHLDALTDAVPDMPVEDRTADTWEPLVAIADLAGGHWPTRARAAVLNLTADRDNITEVSLRVRLLIDIRQAFGVASALSSTCLVERLRTDPEAPWDDLGPKGLDPRRLSNMLREYDITPTNHRWQDGTQSKGYDRADFTDAWNRYCPPPEPLPSQPSQPSQPRSERDGNTTWDGNSRPTPPTRPALTWAGTAGTARDGTPCHACHLPLTHDDGTHTHPTCA
jgi:hypothetical protein